MRFRMRSGGPKTALPRTVQGQRFWRGWERSNVDWRRPRARLAANSVLSRLRLHHVSTLSVVGRGWHRPAVLEGFRRRSEGQGRHRLRSWRVHQPSLHHCDDSSHRRAWAVDLIVTRWRSCGKFHCWIARSATSDRRHRSDWTSAATRWCWIGGSAARKGKTVSVRVVGVVRRAGSVSAVDRGGWQGLPGLKQVVPGRSRMVSGKVPNSLCCERSLGFLRRECELGTPDLRRCWEGSLRRACEVHDPRLLDHRHEDNVVGVYRARQLP